MKTIIRKKGCIGKYLTTGILLFGLSMTANAEYSSTHTFEIDDIQGDFAGNTVATDPSIICMDGSCGDAAAFQDKSGVMLYPVDSEFGFVVSDFVGAAQKERDANYTEGWAGNITSGGELIGLRLSNAKTDHFKVKYPMGSWCAGLGSNTVKCSTEHYTVLEHLMTCYETIPYMFATGIAPPATQKDLIDPETGLSVGNCSIGKLDNVLYEVVDFVVTGDQLVPDADGAPDLIPNESTVRNDIAVNTDYAMTKKDDGKPLYRFGNLIKRPNDLRMYAQMALPAVWKEEGADYEVTRAELIIEHQITNNPNDQIRPEDMENEGAIGRLPRYVTDGSGVWTSTVSCFEGDGDEIGIGTILKNTPFELPAPTAGDQSVSGGDPIAYSEDLLEGLTNGYFTTTDREPFEWSYDSNGDGSPDYSSLVPVDTTDTLLSGPRWRLRPNKFGQDIPGLEIPVSDSEGNPGCIPVPYTSAFIKYSVGDAAITTLNLLDFEDGLDLDGDGVADPSPLLSSRGWVDASANLVNIVDDDTEWGSNTAPNGISVNGLPLTPDFDLAIYVKGDRKPTSIFNVTLVIECEEGCDETTPPETEYNVSLDSFKAPKNVPINKIRKINSTVSNAGTKIANGTLTLVATSGTGYSFQESKGYEVQPGETKKIVISWTAPNEPMTIDWVATIVTVGDTTPDDNELTGSTRVK